MNLFSRLQSLQQTSILCDSAGRVTSPASTTSAHVSALVAPSFRDAVVAAAPDPQRHGGCLVVAEVAQSHDGSLGLAHSFVDAAAEAGADAIKFQTHIAHAESTIHEPWRVKFSRQDATRYDYWSRMEFTAEQWHGLRAHAVERGLLFTSSPFSVEAVELLRDVGVDFWKVASGEVASDDVLDAMAAAPRPIAASTGMSSWAECRQIVDRISAMGQPYALMQCTSEYPCGPESIGLNVMREMRERFACPVGLSDHSGTIWPSLAAAEHGADVVEVHLALDRGMFGPDVPASITGSELRQLVAGIRFSERMRLHPVDKDAKAEKLKGTRAIFGKSLVLRTALPAGTLLQADHLLPRKPGSGIPAAARAQVIGRRLARDTDALTPLGWNDLADAPHVAP